MASGSGYCSNINTNRLMTAEQASQLIYFDSSDNESSDSDLDLDLDFEENESIFSDNDNQLDESDEEYIPPAPKRQKTTTVKGKGKGRAKANKKTTKSTSKPGPSSTSKHRPSCSKPTPIDSEWSTVTEGKTENNFRFHPLRNPGVNPELHLSESSSALDFFVSLFDDEVNETLTNSINAYAIKRTMENTPARKRSVFGRWRDITNDELHKFISVLIYMGMYKAPAIADYWSVSAECYIPWIHHVFNRERFQDIYHTMLHCGDEAAEGKYKIEPFMNLLLCKFRKAFYPFQELSIDEMVIGYKGRWQFKQFNASKPSKYHIKTFGLCDAATGFVVDILTYFGSNTSYKPELDLDGGHAVKVFSTLLEHVGTGHKIFADRYYTTRKLIDYLLSRKQYYTGTVNINRIGFPKEVKTLSLEQRAMKWYINHDKNLLCVAFRDKKAKRNVVLVSTDAEVQTTKIKDMLKPNMINTYNRNMNGCDKLDQKVSYYGVFERKTVKWWKKLFYWMLEVTQANAYILFCLSGAAGRKKISLKDYKKMLMTQLTQHVVAMAQEKKLAGRQPEVSCLEKVNGRRHIVDFSDRDRACAHCSTSAKRVRTHFFCSGCEAKPHLHPKGCFKAFHGE